MPANMLVTMMVFMITGSFSPGPANILALNTMTQHGWKKGKIVLAGMYVGFFAVQYTCTFAIFGLSTYIHSALNILKYVGAAYMVYLGIKMIRSDPDNDSFDKKPSFGTGLFIQLLNAKSYFYTIALLSTYVVPFYPQLWQLLIFGAFAVGLGIAANMSWALAGIKLQKFYSKYYRPVNIILGIFLFYCAFNIIIG